LCDFCLDFSSFLFKKALPHGIIKPTRTCFYAAFKVQAGISGSAFLLSSSRVFLFLFVFVSQSLSLSLSLVLLLNIICFQKSFPAILFSLLLNLPRADKRVETKKKKKEKQRRSAASHHHFGFVVVLLKNNALLTFPLCYVFNNFNRTNRLGKRPSSLASCTTNSTPRTKRRSASIFYRKRYIWRILEAFDYNCGIPLARSDFDR